MWFYTALLSASFSAITVIFSKKLLKNVGGTFLTWCTLLLATPIIAIYAAKEGLPELNYIFIFGVTGSVIFYTISKVIGYRAMKIANLSAIYPLMSLGPVVTLFIATLPPLQEKPSILAVGGVLVTLVGAYVLNVEKAKEGLFQPIKELFHNKASVLMIISVLIDSAVIIFDKLAINNTFPKNTTFTLLVENILVIVGLVPVLFIRNKHFLKDIKLNFKMLFLVGILNAVMTILAFSAVGGGNVGLVATIGKMQLLLVLVLSLIFFKDRPKIQTLLGSIVMVVGVIIIKLGS